MLYLIIIFFVWGRYVKFCNNISKNTKVFFKSAVIHSIETKRNKETKIMGMSASQARLLSLQARQSNLEYQGQQINQERSILSQQCTALYNSLLAMTVPTPPSTQDYTTIKYSGTDGATTFTIGTVKPSGDKYNVELQQTATGNSLSRNYGSSVVSKSGQTLTGEFISPSETIHTGIYTQQSDGTEYAEGDIYVDENPVNGADLISEGTANPEDYMMLTANGYEPVTSFVEGHTYYQKVSKETYDAAEDKSIYSHLRENIEEQPVSGLSASDLSSYYVSVNGTVTQLTSNSPYVKENSDGTYSLNAVAENVQFFKVGSGSDELTNPDAGSTLIAGKTAYDFSTAASEFADEFDWEQYREAIRNAYGTQESSINEDDFYVFFVTSETGVRTPQFALKSDVDSPDGFTETYSYTPNGSYTSSTPTDGCKLEFDAQGRITTISIPSYDATTGELISYRDISLTAETVTDENAYQDAYNQYEYEQYQYDKAQQEINAKTEIIQQEDRNLELKLQRLDNERTQITTEIEAVDKVINDNIEASYKTFSG